MNKRFTILLMAVMAVGCIQDPEEPFNLPDTPTLSVDETSVTRVSMVVNGSFGKNMTDITAYGVEISETLFESGGTYKTLVPQEMGADGFSLGVSDLKSNSTYFLRAFISNGHSRMYSTTLTQKTPETSVASISDVTLKDDYYLVATIEDNGGRSIEDVGFMWSTSSERKDIKREKRYPATLNEDGKTFTLPVNEVGEGTHYIMAYAEDDKDGTGYSRIPYEWVVTSDQGVAIEDPNFKKYLLMYHDGNEDGKMSYAEMEAIESIDVHTDNIKTVREINLMPRLGSLYVNGTQNQSGLLTSLDVSRNTGLSAVDCSNNKLVELNASMIPGLHYLDCLGNPMEVLYLSYYQEFEVLRYPEGCRIVYVDAPSDSEIKPIPIDLGLSVKWGNMNMGSKSPEAYGDYYAWGETETKQTYSWETYKWLGDNPKYGVGYKIMLDDEDDVAHVKLGDKWRLPSDADLTELYEKCTWERITLNGVAGFSVKSKTNGNSIFLPAAGLMSERGLELVGELGGFWASCLAADDYAVVLGFQGDQIIKGEEAPAYGFSIRPVYGDKVNIPVEGVILEETELVLNIGDSHYMEYMMEPFYATNRGVSFSSSDPAVVSVSGQMLTALSVGTAVITVTTDEGGFTAMCVVNVKDPTAQPNNEIWYTTTDGNPITLTKASFGENISLISNTYKDGKGIMQFNGDVTWIGENAFADQSTLTSMVLPESVYEIAFYAFSSCTSLSQIELPQGLLRIYDYAFVDCQSLKEVTIPDSVETICEGAFSGCFGLEHFYGKFADSSGRVLIDGETLLAIAAYGLTSYTVPSGIKSIGGGVFYGLSNLEAVILPQGLLSIGIQAFGDCQGITEMSIPETVTSIGSGAFRYCGKLAHVNIPALVTELPNEVFNSCHTLTGIVIPEGVTIIGSVAFSFCYELTELTLPSTLKSLGSAAFQNCTKLGSITVLAETPPAGGSSMLNDTGNCPIYVPFESVDAYKTAQYWSEYADRIQAIPADIHPVKYLTFTSEGTTKISLSNSVSRNPVLYYSTDAVNWTQWDYSELTFTANNPLYICGDNPEGLNTSSSHYSQFVSSGDLFSVSGDIMSLLDKTEDMLVIPCDYCFVFLFLGCANLTSGPSLPATTLADNCYVCLFQDCTGLKTAPELPAATMKTSCYHSMFFGCTGLTTAPALPATTLATECYSQMFMDCTSLVNAPELPATVMAESCYVNLFRGCTSLTTAPSLPATTLAAECYSQLFSGCTSLSAAPQLPATTLATGCYRIMFKACSSLTEAPALPATTLAESCYSFMFADCTGLTEAPELPASTLAEGSYSYMFDGCSKLSYVKCLATDLSASNCTGYWLLNVASTGTFVKAANTDWPTGSSGIPSGWTVVNDGETPNGGHEGTGEEEWN